MWIGHVFKHTGDAFVGCESCGSHKEIFQRRDVGFSTRQDIVKEIGDSNRRCPRFLLFRLCLGGNHGSCSLIF